MPEQFPITAHSQFVSPKGIFVAIKGTHQDGGLFISEAIDKGAVHIVADEKCIITPDALSEIKEKNILLEKVEDARKFLAIKSAEVAGNPALKLTIMGVTGTKGKTTTCYYLEHIFKTAGYKTALLTSAGNKILDDKLSSNFATPQADYLQQFLALCLEHGVTHVVVEVSAQALSMDRLFGITFDAVVFTNFGLEHLEFYNSMDDYFAAKCALLAMRKSNAPAIIFGDDETKDKLINNYDEIISFGKKQTHDFYIHHISPSIMNNSYVNFYLNKESYTTKTIGTFNVFNITAAIIVTKYLSTIPSYQIQEALDSFSGVPGRGEIHLLNNEIVCVIDYAHNPMSYNAILSSLRLKTNQLIVVFGTGGERDASRRPLMGQIAAQFADYIYLTTDNCRSEDPYLIVQDILSGIAPEFQEKVVIELDRAIAIEKSYKKAMPGAIIAILGKGPEHYQLIKGTKFYFNDLEIIKNL